MPKWATGSVAPIGRRGITSEALAMVTRWAWRSMPELTRLYAPIYASNAASQTRGRALRLHARGAHAPQRDQGRPCDRSGAVRDLSARPAASSLTPTLAGASDPKTNHEHRLQELFDNNRHWADATEAREPGFFSRLLKQQAPQYLWIGCADSRVPANELVGLLPGELFVHRNVANVVVHSDLNCLSVIQFAVDLLKVKHIIVVGHSGCGGVRGGAAGPARRPGRQLAAPCAGRAQPAPGLARHACADERRVDALCELNVLEQALNVCQTTVVHDAWQRGQEVVVHGWVYGLHNGLLEGPEHDRRRSPTTCRRPTPRALAAVQARATTPARIVSARTCSRTRSPTTARSTSRRRCSTASTATTGCSAKPARRPSSASRRPTGTASSARSASASSSTTSASTKAPSGCRREFDVGDAVDGRLAAGQAALHRPADQPPPARAAPRPSSTR